MQSKIFTRRLIFLALLTVIYSKVHSQRLAVSILNKKDVACFESETGSAIVGVKNGIPPYTYVWNSVPPQTSDSAVKLAAGNYTVYVTDAIGKQGFSVVKINQAPKLVATVSSNDANCFDQCDGSAIVVASGGSGPYSYNWSDLNQQSTETAQNLCVGTYTCTITDEKACTLAVTATIKQPSELVLSGTSTPATCGANNGTARVAISGGLAEYKILWSTIPAQTGTVAAALAAGNYTVTVTDKNGCEKSAIVTVKALAGPSLKITKIQHNLCYGDKNGYAELEANGGIPPYIFVWSNGVEGPKQANLKAGSYTCTVTDSTNCSASAVIQITEPAQLKLSTQVFSTTCGENNGSANVTISGGTGSYNITWNTNPVQTTNTAKNLEPGSYIATVKDANGCTKLAKIVIKASEGPKPFIVSTTHNSCYEAKEGTAILGVNGGKAPYKFVWDKGLPEGNKITGLPAGDYTCVVIDSTACSAAIVVKITAPDQLILTTTVTPASCNAKNGTASVAITGGTETHAIFWETTPVQTAATAKNLAQGSYNVLVKDANGCSKSASVTITNSGKLDVAVANRNPTCKGKCDGTSSVLLTTGTPPYKITWLPAQVSGNTIDNLCAGTYTCVALDSTGCEGAAVFNITDPQQLIVSVPTETITECNNRPVTLKPIVSGGTKPYSYLWSNAQITDSIRVNVIGETSYQVVAKDANGCTATGVFKVNNSGNLVEGTVYYTNGTSNFIVKSGVVNLYYADSLGTTTPAATGTIYNGTYKIGNVAKGRYKLMASPDAQMYPYLTSTYFIRAYVWDSAYTKALVCGDLYRADVRLDSIGLTNGTASISGKLTSEKGNNSGIKGVDVNLVEYGGNKLIASTRTDSSGAYIFTKVSPPKPGANYRIFINKPGYNLINSYSCTPRNGDKLIRKNYLMGKTAIYIDPHSSHSDIQERNNLDFKAYPNPYALATTISYTIQHTSIINLTIYNLLGQVIQVLETGNKSAGTYTLLFNANLPTGVYIAKLTVGDSEYVTRLVKVVE